jgi:hypothetical protein
MTLGMILARRSLTTLPPWPSKTPNNVDLGQLGKKLSCTNDAFNYCMKYYLPFVVDRNYYILHILNIA